MTKIDSINDREIYYINVMNDIEWNNNLPLDNWCALTSINADGRKLINEVVEKCIDNNVCYICCSGDLAEETELAFDLEIVRRTVDEEKRLGIALDYEHAPLTVVQHSFSEGLWFAAVVAHEGFKDIDKVVCIDVTSGGLFEQFTDVIKEINDGWLPS